MKTTKFFKLVWLFVLALTFNACFDDGDYKIPLVEIQDPNLKVTNTVQSVLDMYSKSVVDFNTLGSNLVIEGYVVSSDESGNIYKTINIQDKPENPTAAVKLAVDATDLYTFYEVGRKVYVKLNGLALHNSNGVLEIGQLKGTSVERIASTEYKKHIIRSSKVAEIKPLVIKSIKDITDANVSMLIQLDSMHSVNKDITYANIDNTYSVNRKLENCNQEEIMMRNSGFASFKAHQIPNKAGNIVAVLGKYQKNYQLFIRDTNDVNFKEGYDCSDNSGSGSTVGSKTVTELNETFDDGVKGKEITIDGWYLEKTQGDRNWSNNESKGNKYAQISGYNAKKSKIEGWLVTPGLDLTKAENKNFTFESATGYSKGETLEVFISSDFGSKGVTKATWKPLKVKLADKKSSGYSSFLSSGDIDLTTYNGIVHIAFKYTGNNTNQTGTWQVDNVKFNYTSSTTDTTTTTKVEKTISDVRKLFKGSSLTIKENAKFKAVVISDASTKNLDSRNAFLQDATAGIALRFSAAHNLKLGEEVEIDLKDVKISEYKGLLQLSVKPESVLKQTAGILPTPKVITIAQALTGNYESQLVQISGVQFKGITKKYEKSNTLTSDCNDELTVYVTSGATFKSTNVSDKKGTITGVMSKFETPRLYIRDLKDINFTEAYACSSTVPPTDKTVSYLRVLFTGNSTAITENAKIKVIVTSDITKANINGRNAFVQDATAGIALRFDASHSLRLGEEVEISIKDAFLNKDKGLLQLNITSSNILKQTRGVLPTPKTITIAQALTGNYESQLVQINGVQFKDITKTYSGDNNLTSDCSDALTVYVSNGAPFASSQVNVKKGTIKGVMSERDTPRLYIRDTNDVNFTNTYACGSTGSSSGKFDFEDLVGSSTSYSSTGALTATDGTKLEYKARTNVGSYLINTRGLMMKNNEFIKIAFTNGVKQLKFKYRGAFTNTSDRVVIVNKGDENSTTELKKVTFPYNTTSKTFTLDLNQTGSYTITIKGGTSKQIVIDDIEWTK